MSMGQVAIKQRGEGLYLDSSIEWVSDKKDGYINVLDSIDEFNVWSMDTIDQLRTELIRNYYRESGDEFFSDETPRDIIEMYHAIVDVEHWERNVYFQGTFWGLYNLMRFGDLMLLDNWDDWYLVIDDPYDTPRKFYYSWDGNGIAKRRALNDWITDPNALITIHPPRNNRIIHSVSVEIGNAAQIGEPYLLGAESLSSLRSKIPS